MSTLFSNHALRSNVDVQKYKDWFDKTEITNKDLSVAMRSFQKNSKQVLDDRLNTEFGMTSAELTTMAIADIKNILEQNNVNSDEFNIEDIRVYGSYVTGKNKDTSDLDFIVQYSGFMREDDAFNMLHDEGLEITDKNGVVRKIDINPINREKSGTIDEHIGSAYYQSDIKIKPINIEVDSLPNFEKVSELKQWIQDNLNLLGDVEIKDNNRIVHFSKSNIGRSMKGINRNDAKRNSYVALKELVENSVYGYTKPVDERHNKRNNGQEIYHNAFNYNGDVFGIEISIDIPKSDNSTHSYAGHKIKIIKKTPAVNGTIIPDVTGATISITDIQKLFNPNVTEHEGNVLYQSAYHGTPHKFDEFSLDNIGTGEGAQAHGWGLYFAGDKNVSEGYRRTLTGDYGAPVIPVETFYDGEEITSAELALALEDVNNRGKEKVIQDLNDKLMSLKEDLFDIEVDTEEYVNTEFEIKDVEEIIDFVKNADLNKLQVAARKKEGQLFKVDIPENNVLLDEDKTFSEQSEKVKDSLAKLLLDERFNDYFADFESPQEFVETEMTDWEYGFRGGNIYDRLSKLLGSEKDASLLLNQYGIKGITYNGYQDGRCYVIFDDKAIDVIKTYYQENDSQSGEGKSVNAPHNALSDDNIQKKIDKLQDEVTELAWGEKSENNNSQILDSMMEDIEVLETFLDKGGYEYFVDSSVASHPNPLPSVEGNSLSDKDILSRVKKFMGIYEDKQTLNDIHSNLAKKREEQEQKYHGYFTESAEKNIIGILSSSNESTIIHEMGHLFLSGLNEFAQYDEESKKQLEVVNNWLGANGKEYTVAQAEKFARSFEAYLYKGKAPNNTLRGVFNKFKEWMRSIYTHISQIPDADLSFEAQQVFDRIFSGEEYYEKVKAINELSKKVRYTKLSNKFIKINIFLNQLRY